MIDHNEQSNPVVGRLAPSPTGFQHVGNARTYLLAWLSVRLQSGRLILRIEDLDSSRAREDAKRQIIEDLQWLGLDWDFGPAGKSSDDARCLLPSGDLIEHPELQRVVGIEQWFQSKRDSVYQYFFDRLLQQDRLYRCFCTRKEIQQASASAPHQSDEGPIYPGTCRRGRSDDRPLTDADYCWRFKVAEIEDQFTDHMVGVKRCQLSQQIGDFVLRRKSGEFSYQWAVTVDDHLMAVNEVVRGDDLIPSAFRQRQLFHAMQWQPPNYVHVPLVHGEDDRRLAKRDESLQIDYFRKRDRTPEILIGKLAHSCGLIDQAAAISTTELLQHCQGQPWQLWERLPSQPWVTSRSTWEYPVT